MACFPLSTQFHDFYDLANFPEIISELCKYSEEDQLRLVREIVVEGLSYKDLLGFVTKSEEEEPIEPVSLMITSPSVKCDRGIKYVAHLDLEDGTEIEIVLAYRFNPKDIKSEIHPQICGSHFIFENGFASKVFKKCYNKKIDPKIKMNKTGNILSELEQILKKRPSSIRSLGENFCLRLRIGQKDYFSNYFMLQSQTSNAKDPLEKNDQFIGIDQKC